jgi:hypothetical protein
MHERRLEWKVRIRVENMNDYEKYWKFWKKMLPAENAGGVP